jgi:3-deoxy-manno-octulosonate cytidylyltransferase (CMP-KDO synthetase)
MNNSVIIIPSHLKAKRLPNKPLLKIKGKPMIQLVWEQAVKSKIKDVFVATSDKEIFDVIKKAGGKAIMTSDQHTSGSDRIEEATKKLDFHYDVIINVQGDMPMINPDTINMLNDFMITNSNVQVATVASYLKKNELENKNVVKVLTGNEIEPQQFTQAIDFIRFPPEDERGSLYHHIGLYAYTHLALKKFVKFQKSKLEISRSLEQMRFLENKVDIFVGLVKDYPLSVDTMEDLEEIKKKI